MGLFLLLFFTTLHIQAQNCSLDELERLREEIGCEINFISASCSGAVLSSAAVVGAVKKTKLSAEEVVEAEKLERAFQEMSKEWSAFRVDHQKILREYFKILKEKKLTPNPNSYELGYKDLEPYLNEIRKRVGSSKILDLLEFKAKATHGRDVKINDVIQSLGSDLFSKYVGLFTGKFRSVFVRIQGYLMSDELFQNRIDFQQAMAKTFRQFADSVSEAVARIRSGADFVENKTSMKDMVKNVKRVGVNLRPIKTMAKAGTAGAVGALGAFAEAGVVIGAAGKIESCVGELKVSMTNPAKFRLTEYARARPLRLGVNKTSCDELQIDLSILDKMKMGEFPEAESAQVQSFLCAYMGYRRKGLQYQIKEQEPVPFYPSYEVGIDVEVSSANCGQVKIQVGKSKDQSVSLPWQGNDMDWEWRDLSSNSKVCTQTIQQRLLNNPTLPVYERHNLFHPNLVCSYPQDDCLVAVCRLSRFLQSHSEYRHLRSAYCQATKSKASKSMDSKPLDRDINKVK